MKQIGVGYDIMTYCMGIFRQHEADRDTCTAHVPPKVRY